GVSENVVMKMGGWKTASVFRRYDIVVEADLHDAGEKLTQYLIKQASDQPAVPALSMVKAESASSEPQVEQATAKSENQLKAVSLQQVVRRLKKRGRQKF
ncbi:MAG: hypothetical protein ACM3KE_13695, partial [Hyphomicrobiales bacterium]